MDNLRKQHQKEIDVIYFTEKTLCHSFDFQTIHKTFADSAFDRVRVESLSKELTSTKLELDDEKERSVNLAIRLKDLEIRHVETV